MAIDQHTIDLINADIDGEINAAEKQELDGVLRENDAARAMHADLLSLSNSIDSIEALSPPPHLRHVIMNQVKPGPVPYEPTGFIQTLLPSPLLKYLMTFAAGVVLTLSVVSSDRISNQAFDDVTGLVGTVANPVNSTLENTIAIDKTDVAGTVSLRRAGSILILDFDLVANGPVEIRANYPQRKIWFNGFGQLESSGTAISAQTGSVTLGMEGKRRYAVYLYNGGETEVRIDLQFSAGGKVVHTASLRYQSGN